MTAVGYLWDGVRRLFGEGALKFGQGNDCGVMGSALACDHVGPVLYESLRQLANDFLCE